VAWNKIGNKRRQKIDFERNFYVVRNLNFSKSTFGEQFTGQVKERNKAANL
jgi:hypothetical protein